MLGGVGSRIVAGRPDPTFLKALGVSAGAAATSAQGVRVCASGRDP